jgi:hypothetical protein
LVYTKLVAIDLYEMLDLLETLPKYSLGWVGGEFENIITMLVLGFTSSKIGLGTWNRAVFVSYDFLQLASHSRGPLSCIAWRMS